MRSTKCSLGLGTLCIVCGFATDARTDVPPALTAHAAPIERGQPPGEDAAPPPTAYDRLLAETPMALQPQTRGLVHLAGRLVAGLIGVVALIYASLKFLLPRYFKKWSRAAGGELQLVERLSLDGHNAVVLLETRDGQRLLVGTGEHGVQFLTRLNASNTAAFKDCLTAGASLGDRPIEERHAAEH